LGWQRVHLFVVLFFLKMTNVIDYDPLSNHCACSLPT
jgi:hypothetical protein